jgi:cadmium resistance protein CadD (predicted permease)
MEIVIVVNFLVMGGYIALSSRLIRSVPKTWDVLEFRFNLVPFYFKFVGIFSVLAAIAFYIWYSKGTNVIRAEEMLLYHVNMGLLLLIFSKEKDEDELFNQIRLKSIVASFVGVMLIFGMLMPSIFVRKEVHQEWILSFGAIMTIFDINYLVYFYFTKFRMRK